MNLCLSGNRIPNMITYFAKVTVIFTFGPQWRKKKTSFICSTYILLNHFFPLLLSQARHRFWHAGRLAVLWQEDIRPTPCFLWPRLSQVTCRCHRLNCVARMWCETLAPLLGKGEQSSAVLCCVEWWVPFCPLWPGSPWRLMMRGVHFPLVARKNGWHFSLKLVSWMFCPFYVFPCPPLSCLFCYLGDREIGVNKSGSAFCFWKQLQSRCLTGKLGRTWSLWFQTSFPCSRSWCSSCTAISCHMQTLPVGKKKRHICVITQKITFRILWNV